MYGFKDELHPHKLELHMYNNYGCRCYRSTMPLHMLSTLWLVVNVGNDKSNNHKNECVSILQCKNTESCQ